MEVYILGKKNYKSSDISEEKTKLLNIPGLKVLNIGNDDSCYYAISQDYFGKRKAMCPICHNFNTNSSKITERIFKDIIINGKKSDIIDLHFFERWFKCKDCSKSVFPETIDFAEKSHRYTNRLADTLADGTFQYSYKKVCEHYGVPSSTASVGAIMRRRIKYREQHLPELESPDMLVAVEIEYYQERYPLIIGIYGTQINCIDILKDTFEPTYTAFFRKLNSSKIRNIYIEPNDELLRAVTNCFPNIEPSISSECIIRYARLGLKEVIRTEGKHLSIPDKYNLLTLNNNNMDVVDVKKIKKALHGRKRLKIAYKKYQELFSVFAKKWSYEDLSDWAKSEISEYSEFNEVIFLIDLYKTQIENNLESILKLPSNFIDEIKTACNIIEKMPHCIYDVLRGRCMFSTNNDIIEDENEMGNTQKRIGIPIWRFYKNIRKISENILKRRLYEH